MLPGIVQEALSRIGVMLDALFETAEDAVFLMDGLRFVDCNPATLRMFGCHSKDDIVGQTPIKFSPPRQLDGSASIEKVERLVTAAMDGATQFFEWRHCRLDHTEFEVEVRLNRCVVSGVPFLLAVVRDITMRTEAVEALRRQVKSDELVNGILSRCAMCTPAQFDAHIVEALRDVSAFVHADHAYFFVASADGATYSCSHEICGPGVVPLAARYRDVAPGTSAWIERTLVAGETARVDSLPISADPCGRATVVDIESWAADAGCRSFLRVPVSGAFGHSAGAIGVCSHARQVRWSDSDLVLCRIVGNVLTGMTERKRAAERLLLEKRFTEQLVDGLPGIFYLYDSELRMRRWNKNLERLGYTPEELNGKSMDRWFPEEAREPVMAAARNVLERRGTIDSIEAVIARKDGSRVPYLLSGAHVDVPGGPMIVGIGIDISERKQAALERERLMVDLEAASHAKDQFLAVLSHELRSPLAAIQAGVGLMRRFATVDDPRMARAMDVIERSVKLQARLVDDLLDLSRLVRGKLTVQRSAVQLDDAVLSAVQACRAEALRAHVGLETHAESGLWVDADGDRVQQIVINLVGNGVKFTPAGGRVTVRVAKNEQRGQIIVEDTGVGIEADRLPDLFEMFHQGQVAAQRAPGLGIGLALVKSLAEMHGGQVWAESAGSGRGSRFTVELPLCEAPQARGAVDAAVAGQKPIKMLLVEDNSDARCMLAETFADLAYQVVPAENAEVALDILAREGVDVILADIGLPDMDGYEFLRQARHLPAAAHSLAFALTGYGQQSDVRRARDAGYVDHFVKPARADEIDHRIRARMPQGQAL